MTTRRQKRTRPLWRWLCVGAVFVLAGTVLVLSKQRPVVPPSREAGAGVRNREATVTSNAVSNALNVQATLNYGSGPGELGMVWTSEQAPVGPESFAVANDGRVFVADVVNQRIAIYSTNGIYSRSINLPGIALGDVTSDRRGRVYVYDQVRRGLHQFDNADALRSSVNLNPADIDTRGYFHVVGDAVYFADAGVRDVLVAVVKDGVLALPDQSAERKSDGIHGESGRIYSLSLQKETALHLKARGLGPEALLEVTIPMEGIVSARFIGEDDTRRFYLQTERLDGKDIVLELLKFSASGEQLSTTKIPENDYAIWTAKLFDVRNDGAIIQFLPQQEQARLNLFAN